ncbi:hypothetical protein ABZY09_30475 [Streptomyces sp. NPDC002928]|uniref:hypothetical protein n=1 Tax=Streptomyces sp. NPDC002928 TaxID=3154440 RepID=UPI0033AC4274
MTRHLFHRWSRWAFLKFEMGDGFPPEIDRDQQFRMCRTCGHQEIRELVRT